MAKRAVWPALRSAAWILVYGLFTLGALAYADYALGELGLKGLRRIYMLARLPERPLGQSWASPALVRGTLHSQKPRRAPSGRASAIWYGWVEEVRKSGKNSTTITLCARGDDDSLELRSAGHIARVGLFDSDEQIALLKSQGLDTLPLNRVALDFGELFRSRQIPRPMHELCGDKLPATGNLTYYEAHVQSGGSVLVMGCASQGVLSSCGTPPGAILVRGLGPVLHAYANETLNLIRAAAFVVVVALSLLASALFKLREGDAA